MTTITVETYPEQEQYYSDLVAARELSRVTGQVVMLPLELILELSNYRTVYPADHIQALADSMAENGYDPAAPIKVAAMPNGYYQLIAGHCRTRAYRAVNGYHYKTRVSLGKIPAIVVDSTDHASLALMQLSENENRRDPSDVDRANGYQSALDQGATIDQLCKATGKQRDYIDRRLALLTLVTDVQELVSKGQLGISFAYALRDLDSNRQRIAVRHYNTRKPLLEEFIKFCNELHEQQIKDNEANQLFSLQALEVIADTIADKISTESRKSRADLEAENKALRATLEADRQFAIDYAKKQAARIMALSQQLAALQNSAAQTQAA